MSLGWREYYQLHPNATVQDWLDQLFVVDLDKSPPTLEDQKKFVDEFFRPNEPKPPTSPIDL